MATSFRLIGYLLAAIDAVRSAKITRHPSLHHHPAIVHSSVEDHAYDVNACSEFSIQSDIGVQLSIAYFCALLVYLLSHGIDDLYPRSTRFLTAVAKTKLSLIGVGVDAYALRMFVIYQSLGRCFFFSSTIGQALCKSAIANGADAAGADTRTSVEVVTADDFISAGLGHDKRSACFAGQGDVTAVPLQGIIRARIAHIEDYGISGAKRSVTAGIEGDGFVLEPGDLNCIAGKGTSVAGGHTGIGSPGGGGIAACSSTVDGVAVALPLVRRSQSTAAEFHITAGTNGGSSVRGDGVGRTVTGLCIVKCSDFLLSQGAVPDANVIEFTIPKVPLKIIEFTNTVCQSIIRIRTCI